MTVRHANDEIAAGERAGARTTVAHCPHRGNPDPLRGRAELTGMRRVASRAHESCAL